MPRVLGVIPARGGSKRIPGKNLRELCGKPLIQYTIEAAESATRLTNFVVSTEDQNIANVSIGLGAYVVKRPEELATDEATSGAVLKHALKWMETDTDRYDMVVCLHPTSPIRDPKHIDQAIEMLWASDAPSLASVYCSKRHYGHNASIYALKRDAVGADHYSDQSLPFLMDRRHSLDINEQDDLKIAELYLDGVNRI